MEKPWGYPGEYCPSGGSKAKNPRGLGPLVVWENLLNGSPTEKKFQKTLLTSTGCLTDFSGKSENPQNLHMANFPDNLISFNFVLFLNSENNTAKRCLRVKLFQFYPTTSIAWFNTDFAREIQKFGTNS